jgi:hypothetical protein
MFLALHAFYYSPYRIEFNQRRVVPGIPDTMQPLEDEQAPETEPTTERKQNEVNLRSSFFIYY